jgi:hypothetical protein
MSGFLCRLFLFFRFRSGQSGFGYRATQMQSDFGSQCTHQYVCTLASESSLRASFAPFSKVSPQPKMPPLRPRSAHTTRNALLRRKSLHFRGLAPLDFFSCLLSLECCANRAWGKTWVHRRALCGGRHTASQPVSVLRLNVIARAPGTEAVADETVSQLLLRSSVSLQGPMAQVGGPSSWRSPLVACLRSQL